VTRTQGLGGSLVRNAGPVRGTLEGVETSLRWGRSPPSPHREAPWVGSTWHQCRFLAMENEDFVIAARLDGASEWRIIWRHMLPSLSSHIIASLTLAIPLMILAETGLSFLGLGLTPPAISWGVLLKEAQNIVSISQAPWLFIPGGFVVLAVLAFNFLGDGIRDAADPYGH